jgi:hypothetical protein
MLLLLRHLLGSMFRAFFRMIITAFFCGSIAGGAVLVAVYVATRQWPPQQLTLIAAAAVAVLAAYAGAVTVLLGETLRGLAAAVGVAERDVKATVKAVETEIVGAPQKPQSRAS